MASIAEIRAKYPQYNDMSDQQMADALHTKFYSDMPRQEFDAKIGLTAEAPPLMKPGSREYADWAMTQARAGNKLPQVSEINNFEEPKFNDLQGKFMAGFTSAVDAVPFAGPTLLDMAQKTRASVQGVPLEDVQAETAKARADNPITSGIGTVAGAVGPFLPLGGVPGLGRVLGMTGSLPSKIGFGAVSGMGIAGGDTAARGGSMEDIVKNAALGFGFGGIAPVAFAGAGKAWNALTGKTASKAASNVGRAMTDDGIDPASLSSRLSALGPDAMLMDLGPNLQAQAGALAAVPGSGQKAIREAVTQRASAKAKTARVTDDVTATVGQGPDIDLLKQKVVADQSAAATPLYDAVRDVPLPIAGNFQFVLQTPMGKEAFRQAAQLAANDGKAVNGLTVGLVDYAKRALDDIATTAARAGENNKARQAGDLARILRTEADKVVPGYKAAREAFAGPAAVLDAVDNGTQIFSRDITVGQLDRMLKAMTASEKDGYLQGVRHYVESQMGNTVNDALTLRNMFRKGWNEGKLRLVLGDDIADDLLKRIDREVMYGKTTNVVEGNSETARRNASMGEVDPTKRDVSQVNLVGLVLAAVNKARQALAGSGQKKVNDQMAAMLSGKGGAAVARQLQNGMRPVMPGMIAPGGAASVLAVPEKRQPVELLITGGNPALSARP
jgi:hypothetical protein